MKPYLFTPVMLLFVELGQARTAKLTQNPAVVRLCILSVFQVRQGNVLTDFI